MNFKKLAIAYLTIFKHYFPNALPLHKHPSLQASLGHQLKMHCLLYSSANFMFGHKVGILNFFQIFKKLLLSSKKGAFDENRHAIHWS
jgi:hypothetical protein